jgi:hypothetical protein
LTGKDYLTENNKNWSACAVDTHKHIEKIAEHYDFWGGCNYNAYNELISGMCTGSHPKKLLLLMWQLRNPAKQKLFN